MPACSGSGEQASESPKQEPQARDEPVAASAAALTLAGITATKVGNYRSSGGSYSLGSATNYRVGNIAASGTDDYRRGYAVFDLSGVNGTITGATVRFANGSSSGSAQTFSLLAVSTSNIANLGNTTSSSTLYNDLGDNGSTNNAYYSATLSPVNANPQPDATGFALGGSAVTNLNNAKNTSPFLFAVGMMYYEGSTNSRYVFDNDKTGAILYLTVNNRSAGQTCSANSDCASNACAGGYCCSGACSGANGTATCAMSTGTCSVTCDAGYADCSGGVADGCETNINTTTKCGTTCANAVSCDDSNACTVDQCSSGACTNAAGNAGTTCRAAVAGGCDVAETCTGSSTACPADVVRPNGTSCRASAGGCDVAETCNGTSNACPADAFVASGTQCRAASGGCDVAESCTGSSAACPADGFVSNTTVCRSAVTVCDVAEKCTGSSGNCPADAYASSTTTCRAAADVCDVAEKCTGTSTVCPSDALTASGTPCRATAGSCDVAEYCTGSAVACPTDQFLPSTTMCRSQGGNVCDSVDFCSGTSAACSDGFAAQGTDCAYASGATVIWQSGSANGTVDRNSNSNHWSSTNATEVASASAPGNWGSNVMKFVTTSSSVNTSNRYNYTRLASSSHNPSGNDLFEYDVYLDDNVAGIGGLDVKISGSSTYWSTLGAPDQNGIDFDPASDISGQAYHRWYHRRFAVPSGSQISLVDLAVERDTASVTSTAYYDNVMFTTKLGACDGAGVCKLKDGVGCSGNSSCAGGLCAGNACVTPAPNGTACTANYQCISNFCTDSVCCESQCGADSVDCLACSIAAGSTADGVCKTAANGTVCRALANACDIVEICDGTSTACPADTTL